MNGGSRIIDFQADRDTDPTDADTMLPQHEHADLAPPPGDAATRALAIGALLAGGGWIAWIGWLLLRQPTALPGPAALIQLAAAAVVPPVALLILWMVARRSGDAATRRFGALQRTMRAEADRCESRMLALSERIAADRALLDEHMRELMETGDSATARMHAVAAAMNVQVESIHASARLLGESSDSAGKRLAVLLAQLPKARDEVQAMTAAFDRIGADAGEHAGALGTRLAELAERSRHADELARGAALRLATHITEMETTSETAGHRLEAVTARMSQEVAVVLEHAAVAIEQARHGIAAQGEAAVTMLATNQATLDQHVQAGLDGLRDRLAMIERAIGDVAALLGREQEQADALFASLDHNVARATAQIDLLHENGTRRTHDLSERVTTLTAGVDAMRDAMTSGDDVAKATMTTAETLLTALDAAAREIDETLPGSLARLNGRVEDTRRIVAGARPDLVELLDAAERTHAAIESIDTSLNRQRDMLAMLSTSLSEALDDGATRIDAIEGTIGRTIAETRGFADDLAPRLVDTLARIRETADAAADHARTTLSDIIPDAARRMEDSASEHLTRAFENSMEGQLAALAKAAEDAARIAIAAADRVGQQTQALTAAAARVETQIERAEAADRDSFARRVSLLIEAMNSSAIDITKALSSDITDTAWAAYLKGDRGVFTRRAVRLLEPAQLREIAALYDADGAFQDQVNRYIHDFEAMLRMVLAQRDGSPMGVTLLSSDTGKLYVALAQAIERLRT